MKVTIKKAQVIVLRNRPAGSEGLPEDIRGVSSQETRDYSIFIRLLGAVGKQEFVGLGEARPSRLSGEKLSRAVRYAKALAESLAGEALTLDAQQGDALLLQLNERLNALNASLFSGEVDEAIRQRRLARSVRLAVECALLDLVAKQAQQPVAALLGSRAKDISRNVFNDALKDVARLHRDIEQGALPRGWLRHGRSIGAMRAATLVNSLLRALEAKPHDLQGIILNAGQTWSVEAWQGFCDRIEQVGLAVGTGVDILVEDPFAADMAEDYRQAFARSADLPVRIMIAEPVWDADSLEEVKAYLPEVDLKISPQRAGGFLAALDVERRAKRLGFDGGVFVAGPPSTTNLNTLMTMALAGSLENTRYFPSTFKQEGKIRLVHPRAELVEDRLRVPEGPGWATNLCRSAVRKRLVTLHGYDSFGKLPRREVREELMQAVYDDRFLTREKDLQTRFAESLGELESVM
jgi:L-alanine-DL-glutamate epimerase-like enolase superfamily enzyme